MDNGQTDPKTDDRQTIQKMIHQLKRNMFPAEHIFFKVPHHVPIYVDFYRLNWPTA